MKIPLFAFFIALSTLCTAQKFSSDFCNNLKIISNDAKNSYKNVVKKYKGYYREGVYFISEPEVGTDVYAVDTANSNAFYYRSFNDDATAQKFLNDVLEPELQKCYGDKNWEFDMSDFSRVWALPSSRPGADFKMRLATRASNNKIMIVCFFDFVSKK
jgi:hypothetical protein